MKRLLILIGSLPGFIIILTTATVNQLIDSYSVEILDELSQYISQFGSTSQLNTQLVIIAVKISKYSQLLITIGVVWVMIFAFIWYKHREKRLNDKENKK